MIKGFVIGVTVVLGIYSILAVLLTITADYHPAQYQGLIWAGIIAAVNVVTAFLIVLFAITKDQTTFIRIFLSGVAIRLFIMLAMIFVILRYSQLNRFVFIVAFFILYFLLQGWEMIVLNKHLTKRQGV